MQSIAKVRIATSRRDRIAATRTTVGCIAKAVNLAGRIAKLDRLSRNLSFLSALMENGVDFVVWDNPSATRLTVHILAAAENERFAIRERIRMALAAAKVLGKLLGSARTGH